MKIKIALAASALLALAATNASAKRPKIDLSVGAGVGDFAYKEVRTMTGTAGTWDVRAALGLASRFTVEAAYVGSAQSIDTLGMDANTVMLSSGAEAAGRINILPGNIQPFAFVGAAYKRVSLVNSNFNTSSVKSSDNMFEIPMGLGLGYKIGQIVLEARGTYRADFSQDLVPPATAGGSKPSFDNWAATARAGWSF